MPDKVEVSQQVAWNLGSSLIMQISNLLQNASNHFIAGRIGSAFTIMQAIRLIVDQDLDAEERQEIIKQEKKAASIMNHSDVYRGFEIDHKKKTSFFQGRQIYLDYHNQIMAALKKHSYTVPAKQDTVKIR